MASSSVAGTALSGRFKGLRLENACELSQSARKGVKPDLFYSFAKAINMPGKPLAGILNLSARTLINYKEQKKNLKPIYSEHLLKLITLFDKDETVFGTIPEFNYWLQKPFWNANEKPQDWQVTPGGVDLLIKELKKSHKVTRFKPCWSIALPVVYTPVRSLLRRVSRRSVFLSSERQGGDSSVSWGVLRSADESRGRGMMK